MAACDVLLQPYPDGASSRRTSTILRCVSGRHGGTSQRAALARAAASRWPAIPMRWQLKLSGCCPTLDSGTIRFAGAAYYSSIWPTPSTLRRDACTRVAVLTHSRRMVGGAAVRERGVFRLQALRHKLAFWSKSAP